MRPFPPPPAPWAVHEAPPVLPRLGALWSGRPRAGVRPRWTRLSPAVLVVLSGELLALLALALVSPLNLYDEGYVLYPAARVLEAQVPYRDFWFGYMPAQLYVLASLFRVFGTTVVAARVWDALVRFALCVFVYVVVRRLAARAPAVAGSLLTAAWLGVAGFYAYPLFPALAAALAAISFTLNWTSRQQRRDLALAGLCLALATVFKLEIGVYATASTTAAVLAGGWFRGTSRRAMLGAAASLLGSALLPLTAVLGLLAAQVPVSVLWYALVEFSLTVVANSGRLPLPSLVPTFPSAASSWIAYLFGWLLPWIQVYVPLAILGCSTAWVAWTAFRSRRQPSRSQSQPTLVSTSLGVAGTVALTLLGWGLLVSGTSRADGIHLLPLAIVALVLLLQLPFRLTGPRAGTVARQASLALLPVLGLAVVFGSLVGFLSRGGPLWPPDCSVQVPRAGCLPLRTDQAQALSYVRLRTDPGERIFVGNTRHERATVSDLTFYFLAARAAAPWSPETAPGLATGVRVQNDIVRDLERYGVRYVVLTDEFDEFQAWDARLSSGVTILDDYIATNYVPVERFGRYTILTARDPEIQTAAGSASP